MKALQGGMVLQMFHLPALESSDAERVRSNAQNQLLCALLTYLLLAESFVSTLGTTYSNKVRKEWPVCLFLSTLI